MENVKKVLKKLKKKVKKVYKTLKKKVKKVYNVIKEVNAMILKRKIYDKLLDWKKNNGKTALLIEGARRVGKSTIVETFAKNEYKSYILIDFNIAKQEIKDIFEKYASDLDTFFFMLSSITGTTLYERDTLIIFDEVQMFPKARQLIKYLTKDRRYDYIQTGSLLSIKTNVENITIPSDEESIKMYPLDFEEFLYAIGSKQFVPIIRNFYSELKPLGPIHKTIMEIFRKYLLIGGMPEAVTEYLNTNDYTKVDKVKNNILSLYRNDIAKFAKGHGHKVLSIFDEIPSQLSKHEKKFTLKALEKSARFRDYEESFMWLNEAMITNLAFNANDPSIALSLNRDRLTVKAYMADTGLLINHAFNLGKEIPNEIIRGILLDNPNMNNGMIFENVVAQMLTANNNKLYFYSRTNNKDHSETMEIDYLIIDKTNPTKISPIEVKSGKNYTLSSLKKFSSKFGKKIGRKYLLHTKDLSVKDEIIYLPVYMAGCL